jgi:CYTH domain-containing protein
MEIERKWLVKITPDLIQYKKIAFERYFIFIGDTVEVRVQKVDDKYEFERKTETSILSRDEIKFEITKEEFDYYKSICNKSIIRDAYEIASEPNISLKIYHGNYEGLLRVEVEFSSEDEANSYKPLNWFGPEITNSEIGRDKKLIQLDKNQFKIVLAQFKQ